MSFGRGPGGPEVDVTQLALRLMLTVGYTPRFIVPKLPHVPPKHIVGGTYDPGDPAVIELFDVVTFAPTDCNGDSSCLQQCTNASNQACSSGAGCICGSGGTCTSELIGPQTLLTAGHCTDLTAGGEIAGQGGPAMTVCTNLTDANNVLGGTPTPNCNLVVLAIFNNTCPTNDAQGDCEFGLINGVDGGPGGNFILVDEMVNPGYDGTVTPPGNDNDVGLCHLSQSTLENGGAEPPLLTFNRTDEGSACTSLGDLKFVGYGITSGSGQVAGVKMSVTHADEVLDTYHNFEGADPYSSCGSAGSKEPTCSGDSGGPSFNSNGVIMGTVSLGDGNCTSWGQDARADAYASFFDCQMQCWSEPINGGAGAPSCSSYTCVYAPVQSSSSSSSSGGSSSSGASSTNASASSSSSSSGTSVSGSGSGSASSSGSAGSASDGTSGASSSPQAASSSSTSRGPASSAEASSNGSKLGGWPRRSRSAHDCVVQRWLCVGGRGRAGFRSLPMARPRFPAPTKAGRLQLNWPPLALVLALSSLPGRAGHPSRLPGNSVTRMSLN